MHKTIICLIFILLVLGGCSKTDTPPEKKEYLYVDSISGLSLRETPSKFSKRLSVLPHKTKIILVERKKKSAVINGLRSEWCKIRYKKMVGWAFGAYLTEWDLFAAGNIQERVAKNGKARLDALFAKKSKIKFVEKNMYTRNIGRSATVSITLHKDGRIVFTTAGVGSYSRCPYTKKPFKNEPQGYNAGFSSIWKGQYRIKGSLVNYRFTKSERSIDIFDKSCGHKDHFISKKILKSGTFLILEARAKGKNYIGFRLREYSNGPYSRWSTEVVK